MNIHIHVPLTHVTDNIVFKVLPQDVEHMSLFLKCCTSCLYLKDEYDHSCISLIVNLASIIHGI